jgi:hypothetical protein
MNKVFFLWLPLLTLCFAILSPMAMAAVDATIEYEEVSGTEAYARISWVVQLGDDYDIEYSEDLIGPWTLFPGGYDIVGDTATFTDDTVSSTLYRYYRIRTIGTSEYSNWVGFFKIGFPLNDLHQISFPIITDDMRLNDGDDTETCIGDILKKTLEGNLTFQLSPTIFGPVYAHVFIAYDMAFLYTNVFPPAYKEWVFSFPTPPDYDLPLSSMSIDNTCGYFVRGNAAGDSVQYSVMYGDVETSDTVSIYIRQEVNMLCFPYPVGIDVNDDTFIRLEDGAYGSTYPELGDRISRYTGNGGYEMAFLFNSNGAYPQYDNKWIDLYTYTISDMRFEAGESFYYEHRLVDGFTWNVQRPYNLD